MIITLFTSPLLIAQTETNNNQTIENKETNTDKGGENLRTGDLFWLSTPLGRGIYYSAGLVGIGTDNPTTDLDVAGTIRTTGFVLPGGNNGDVLTFNSLGSAYWAAPPSGGSLWSEVSQGIIYNPIGTNINVGIGTSAPDERLHVAGTILTEGGLKLLGSSNQIVFGNETSSTFQIARNLATRGTSPPPEGAQQSILTVDINNNVGIGTTNPGVKLDVDGAIRTNEELLVLGKTTTNNLQINSGNCQQDYVLTAIDINGNAMWKDINEMNIGSAWSEDANGNIFIENASVGIGTATPQADLDVAGNIKTTGFQLVGENIDGHILKSSDDGTASWQTPAWSSNSVSVYKENGYVGIGTIPLAPLHLEFNNSEVGIRFGDDGKSSKSGSDFEIYTKMESESPYLIHYNSSYTSNVKFGWSIFTPGIGRDIKMLLEMDNTLGTNLTIKGNVFAQNGIGIGTNDIGSHALAVNGSINTKEIVVTETVPGSDYVFEEGYVLMPLSDLEKFVTEKKHLPEVMSAKEFAENGYNLGEMDDVLLRKVEELTLYIIQQQKEIDGLKEKLENINN